MDDRIRRLEQDFKATQNPELLERLVKAYQRTQDPELLDIIYLAGADPFKLSPLGEALRLTAPVRELWHYKPPYPRPRGERVDPESPEWDERMNEWNRLVADYEADLEATYGTHRPVFHGPKEYHYGLTKRRIARLLDIAIQDRFHGEWGNKQGDVVINGITFRLLPRCDENRKPYARRLLIICPECGEGIGLQSFHKHARDEHPEAR